MLGEVALLGNSLQAFHRQYDGAEEQHQISLKKWNRIKICRNTVHKQPLIKPENGPHHKSNINVNTMAALT